MGKGALGGIIAIAFALGVVVVVWLLYGLVAEMTTTVASDTVKTLEVKSNYDFDEFSINKSLNYSIADAAYENGLKGALLDYSSWDTYDDYVVWKEGSCTSMPCGKNNIPDESKVGSDLTSSIEAEFSGYGDLLQTSGNINSLEVLKNSLGNYYRKNITTYFDYNILTLGSTDKMNYGVNQDNFELKNVYNLRYFHMYDVAKTFTENADALVNRELWDTIQTYEDHKDGTNSCKGTCNHEDNPCPSFDDVGWLSPDPDADLQTNLNSLATDLETKTGLEWEITVEEGNLENGQYKTTRTDTVDKDTPEEHISGCNEYEDDWSSGSCSDSWGQERCRTICICKKDATRPFTGSCPDGWSEIRCFDVCECKECIEYSKTTKCDGSSRTCTFCADPSTDDGWGYYYDRDFEYDYNVKVEIKDPESKIETFGGTKDLKMVFAMKGTIEDSKCRDEDGSHYHTCSSNSDSGDSAPSNPYPSEDVGDITWPTV